MIYDVSGLEDIMGVGMSISQISDVTVACYALKMYDLMLKSPNKTI